MRSPGRGQRGRQRWSSRDFSDRQQSPSAAPNLRKCCRSSFALDGAEKRSHRRTRPALAFAPPSLPLSRAMPPARDAPRVVIPRLDGDPSPAVRRAAPARRAAPPARRRPIERRPDGSPPKTNRRASLPRPPLHDARASAARPAPGPDRAARAARRSPSRSPRAPRAGTASSRGREPPRRSPDPRAMFFLFLTAPRTPRARRPTPRPLPPRRACGAHAYLPALPRSPRNSSAPQPRQATATTQGTRVAPSPRHSPPRRAAVGRA